jgi:hypothetical protein
LTDLEMQFMAAANSYLAIVEELGVSDSELVKWKRGKKKGGPPSYPAAWRARSNASVLVLQILARWLLAEGCWSSTNWFDVFVPSSFVRQESGTLELSGKTIWGVGRGVQRQGPLRTTWQFDAADRDPVPYS